MKKYSSIVFAFFLMACGASDSSDSALQELRAEKDSLLQVKAGIEDRIRELSQAIGEQSNDLDLIQVTTLKVDQGDFSHYLEVYGNIESAQNVLVYPEMNGLVTDISISEGEKVSKGQLLARLDSEVLLSNLKEIETNLELATTIFEKQKRLWEQEIGSEVQYLEAKNRKESLESTKATLKAQIEKSQIRAPFTGIVDEVFPKKGEMAAASMPFLRLVNLKDVYIKADVSEEYLKSIHEGTKTIISIDNLDTTFVGKVDQVGQFINPNNRTFKVRVNLDNSMQALKPNMLARIKIKDFELNDSAISIPSRILQQSPQGDDYVMLYKNGSVERRNVKAAISYDARTLIKEGLSAGEILIDKGARSVNNGQEVALAEDK